MANPLIQVCGDPTVDWMTIHQEVDPGIGPFFWMSDQAAMGVGLSVQAGGAALLTEFLKVILPKDQAKIEGVTIDPEILKNPFAQINRSWMVWQQQGRAGDRSAYRIRDWAANDKGVWEYEHHRLQGRPDLLVIEDSGLGFRTQEQGWPETLSAKGSDTQPELILVKLSLYGGGERSPVLDRIIARGCGAQTTILTSISDLRTCAVRIPQSLSWERMLEQLVAAVYSPACPFVDPKTDKLLFGRLIVTIGTAGAVIITDQAVTLIFDRSGQEGDFERRFEGHMLGYNTCLVGTIAASWLEQRGDLRWQDAVHDGIALARLLHVGGYEVANRSVRFPAERLTQGYAARGSSGNRPGEREKVWDLGIFTLAPEILLKSHGNWTILSRTVHSDAATGSRSEIMARVHQKAREIAIQGASSALQNVPVETIGKWRSADRYEIEGVRSVKNAMQEYLGGTRRETPLAIAVFGPPGSGKSFAVKQVAKELGIEKDEQLTFNLSQFESPDELASAFHQIQDLHLQGKRPLVFWDEFDTPSKDGPLGWLRYFLAPIQDGHFSDRGRLHPTGGGIYVFAGGTRPNFDQFSRVESDTDRAAKKPDFVSRLRAYINVRGPNGDPNLVEDDLHAVRRAFLLNALLETHHPHLKHKGNFEIGNSVLNAFLHTVRYQHGARSMESIVSMSSLKSRKTFELSSLPPEHLLSMHVYAKDFISLAEGSGREMLRVGITGHIGLDPSLMDRLEQGIEEAIRAIETKFPNRWLTAFSPMAVGADRLVARKLLERPGSRLIAVLPMLAEEYVKDFGPSDSHLDDYVGAEARQEFWNWLDHRAIEKIVMPPSATRDESYERVGFYIAEHSDVMIAVYDGKESQGRGGTADIVNRVRELGKPLCHVWAGNYKKDPAKRTDASEKHGKVTFENFSATNGRSLVADKSL